MSISNEKGEIGEAAFALAAAQKGYWAGKMPQDCPYDYALDKGDGKLLRVQVKYRTMTSNSVSVKLACPNRTNRTIYSSDNIDFLAIYVNELANVYLIPITDISDVTEVRLQCNDLLKKYKNSRLISQYANW